MPIVVGREIAATRVRVQRWPGEDLGEMSLTDALLLARTEGLDLDLTGMPSGGSVAHCALRDISQYLCNERFDAELTRRLAARASGPWPVESVEPEVTWAPLPRWVHLESISELWGEGRRRLDPSAAQRLDLPDSSKAYLVSVGLPSTFFNYELDFGPRELLRLDTFNRIVEQADQAAFDETVRRLSRNPPNLRRGYSWPPRFKLARHRLLGRYVHVGALCVEEGSGAVVLVSTFDAGSGERRDVKLVNSSVELLGQFLYLSQSSLQERATSRRLRALSRLFERLDPPAMNAPGAWPSILEGWLSELEEA